MGTDDKNNGEWMEFSRSNTSKKKEGREGPLGVVTQAGLHPPSAR